jgi:hypothetical protein
MELYFRGRPVKTGSWRGGSRLGLSCGCSPNQLKSRPSQKQKKKPTEKYPPAAYRCHFPTRPAAPPLTAPGLITPRPPAPWALRALEAWTRTEGGRGELQVQDRRKQLRPLRLRLRPPPPPETDPTQLHQTSQFGRGLRQTPAKRPCFLCRFSSGSLTTDLPCARRPD